MICVIGIVSLNSKSEVADDVMLVEGENFEVCRTKALSDFRKKYDVSESHRLKSKGPIYQVSTIENGREFQNGFLAGKKKEPNLDVVNNWEELLFNHSVLFLHGYQWGSR